MKMSKLKDVDSYIANSPREAHPIMDELRKTIKSTVPKVEEAIKWGVPFYSYYGALAGFAVYKNHVSFGFSADVLQDDERRVLEDKGYKTGVRTVQIKFDQKVPTTIIKRILRTHAKMNEVKRAKK